MSESPARLDPGSFRDPAGRIYAAGDRIFRTVSEFGAPNFRAASEAGVLERMARGGRLISSGQVQASEILDLFSSCLEDLQRSAHVLTHPRLTPITYPYEWSFEALRAAALAHLDLQLSLLDSGFTLSDASAFNMQFEGPKPLHIDVLSVVPYEDGAHWQGYEQFQRHFLNPLVLEAETGVSFGPWWRGTMDGIASDDVARLLPLRARLKPSNLMHVVLPAMMNRRALKGGAQPKRSEIQPLPKARLVALLKHLRSMIASLRGPSGRTTPWLDYAGNNSYAARERSAKHDAIEKFVAEVRPDTLLDIGCNTGEYAALAIEAGARRVVGLESDRAALDAAYLRARTEKLAFLPLGIDIANPSPAQGWRGAERSAFVDRIEADCLMALAVIHHIVMRNNVPLSEAAEQLVSLAPRGVIEFVPKGDPQVDRLLRYRDDIFFDYEIDAFRRYVSAHARIVEETVLTDSGRVLVRYER